MKDRKWGDHLSLYILNYRTQTGHQSNHFLTKKRSPLLCLHLACSLCNEAYATQDLQCLCKGEVALHHFPISLRK